MARWLLVRHGETDWNREGRVQGHVATSLNERGLRQAAALRERLAGEAIEAAYVCDLPRSMETAREILKGRAIALSLCPELRELAYGQWEGLTFTEVQARDPEKYAELLKGEAEFAPPGGESLHDLSQRVSRGATRIASAHGQSEGGLLLVGHAGSLRALALHLLGLPLAAFWRLGLAPASLSLIQVYPEGAVLELWNDTSHCRGIP